MTRHGYSIYSSQKGAINETSKVIRKIWLEKFPVKYLVSQRRAYDKIDRLLESYSKNVQKRGSKRTDKINFRKTNHKLLDLLKTDMIENLKMEHEDLFNFYCDQTSKRNLTLNNVEDLTLDENENEIVDDSMDYETDETNEWKVPSNAQSRELVYLNRSGCARTSTDEKGTQTDSNFLDFPFVPLNKNGRYYESVKNAISMCSVQANITVQQARISFCIISNEFFGQKYILESNENESGIEQRNHIPSRNTIVNYKHNLSINAEIDIAKRLIERSDQDKVNLFYDTTTRKNFPGEMTTFLISIGNEIYSMRSLPLGQENRSSIVDLFIEQLSRIGLMVDKTAKEIWEEIHGIMTDGASKNMNIEKEIGEKLESDHEPIHVLCNAHFCLCCDKGNLLCLKKIEEEIQLKVVILSRIPELKSFLTGKCIVLSAIEAINKLVLNDGHKSSLYEEFDVMLNKENKTKKFHSFDQKRFGALGYTAAVICHHIEDIQELLNTTKSNNLLVRSCRLYVSIPYIMSAILALAKFTSKITIPFLNFVEKESQVECVKLFPMLYEDLKNGKMDSLLQYHVAYSFKLPEEEDETENLILELFCKQAAQDLALQKGREYHFGNSDLLNERATRLDLLAEEKLKNLPVTNIVAEREFAKFDKMMRRSGSSTNKNFTGAGIKDDLVLLKHKKTNFTNKTYNNLVQILNLKEKQWLNTQKEVVLEKISKNAEIALKNDEKNNNLLKKCKEWGGPITTFEELNDLVNQRNPVELKKIIKSEISFKKITCPRDVIDRPSLYKLNKLSVAELKANLTVILTTHSELDVVEICEESEVLDKIQNLSDSFVEKL